MKKLEENDHNLQEDYNDINHNMFKDLIFILLFYASIVTSLYFIMFK